MAKKSLWNEEICGIKVKSIIACLVVIVCVYLVADYYGAFDKMTVTDGQGDGSANSSFKIKTVFNNMYIGTFVVADESVNFNEESNVVAIQIDAEKTSNATYTTFSFPVLHNGVGRMVAREVSQSGVLSTPSVPVTVPVHVVFGVSADGFSNVNEVFTSSISASASTLKTADGKDYSPVVMKNGKPLVNVNGTSAVKNFTWTYSKSSQTIDVSFDLDWEAVDQMTSVSDEILVSIKPTNSDKDLTVRIIKNSAI